ncbi:MAG TPA: hypothetical protein VNM37_11010, partial [Candidatus Dormibacteraeota bacterium]|nr:hypothetical protein [Candidatus Dormibacteraeota bacterium]
MKDKLNDPCSARLPVTQAEAVRKPVIFAAAVAIITLGSVVGYTFWKSPARPVRSAIAVVDTVNHDSQQANVVATQAEEVVEVDEIAAAQAVGVVPRAVETVSRPALPQGQAPRPELTPFTRQLVTSLTELELNRGPFSGEQADQWKHGLQQLIQQGNAAVPAIREFLEQNRDLNFGNGSSLGYSSLRSAFFDALQQIGGPESQALLSETLQTTSVPSEIARLARYLEQQAPGQFRDQIGAAARETLGQAARGELRGWDVGPLFQVLQTYGHASVVSDLERNASKWNYYSVLTLANLPSGEGIPSLIRLAQEPSANGSARVAMEALAQVAVQSADASAALVEMARSGRFSERNWIEAAAA